MTDRKPTPEALEAATTLLLELPKYLLVNGKRITVNILKDSKALAITSFVLDDFAQQARDRALEDILNELRTLKSKAQ